MLTTAANNALAAIVTVPGGVEATARAGNLTLTGAVRYGSQRTAACLAVAGLTGVSHVKDEIEIWTDADPVDVTLLVRDARECAGPRPDAPTGRRHGKAGGGRRCGGDRARRDVRGAGGRRVRPAAPALRTELRPRRSAAPPPGRRAAAIGAQA